MIIHEGYNGLHLENPVATMGIFDGVHLGHMQILSKLSGIAGLSGSESVVITFYPHPRIVLGKVNTDFFYLSTSEEKRKLLEKAGIDHLVIIEFTRKFSEIKACDFIKNILIDKLGTRQIVVGYDHHFGWKGEGNLQTIKQCCDLYDFRVEQAEGYFIDGVAVSSSGIRAALIDGNIVEANKMLGYHYGLTGEVIRGKGLGRALGFPTANLKPDDRHKLVPASGVYAIRVQVDGSSYNGVLSIGSNPTVSPDSLKRSIEAHIIDFEGNIYGKSITIQFIHRLRDEKKFANTGLLTEQMEHDRAEARRLLT